MSGIFISYRREDTLPMAGRLHDQLVRRFENEPLFMDIDSIQPGRDFIEELEKAVEQCDVMLVLVGKQWVSVKDEHGNRRIDGDDDFVRLEISAGLARGIPIVPVLVERAPMPRATELPPDIRDFCRRQALEITHSKFKSGAQELIETIEKALPFSESKDELSELTAEKISRNREAEKQAQVEAELEGLWLDALAASYTRKWSIAVELLAEIVKRRPDYRDAATKFQTAKRKLELDTMFGSAKKALDARSWDTAVDLFSRITALESDYKGSQALLIQAQHHQKLARLYDEGHQLHGAKKWAAVVRVFEEIHLLDGDYPDPDDLLETSLGQVEAIEQARRAEEFYRQALRHIDANELKEAQIRLTDVEELQSDYKETQALLTRIQELLGTLSLGVSAGRRQFKGSQVTWTVSLKNKGSNPLLEVNVIQGRKLLAEPFEMPAGKRRRLTFKRTYQTTGRKTAKVNVVFALSSGEILEESKTGSVEIVPPARKPRKKKPQVTAFKPEDVAEVAELRRGAERGDSDSQVSLGWMYEMGRGVTKNYFEAVKWYRRAAEKGNLIGENNLGFMYKKGHGVTKNSEEAVKWIRRAAKKGYADSENWLGICYETGDGVTQNNAEAEKWYRRAANQGNLYGQYNLARMYENGTGVWRSVKKAVEWYKKAAAQNHESSKTALKRLGKT